MSHQELFDKAVALRNELVRQDLAGVYLRHIDAMIKKLSKLAAQDALTQGAK